MMSGFERDERIENEQPAADHTVQSTPTAPTNPSAPQRRFIDLLREASAVHGKLETFYQRMSERAVRPKARLLLEFMRDHERNMRECIREFEENSGNGALQAWFKYTPAIDADAWIAEIDLRPNMTDEDIAGIVAQMDDALLEAFRQVAERAVPENVREAVENFLELETREKIRALRATDAE